MSAVDMLFVLNAAGKISRVSPRPHHLEPADLQPPLGVGEVAPDFSLPDVTGAFTSLRVGSAAITLVIAINVPGRWDGTIAYKRSYATTGIAGCALCKSTRMTLE
jgi:hypothetical protein